MRFILRGKDYALGKEDVETKMLGVSPEVVRRYYVVVNGKKYPPKQVIGKLLRLGRVEFTTMDASSILQRLGFALKQM